MPPGERGVNAAQPLQTESASAKLFQIRYEDTVLISHNDMGNDPFAIDQETYLTIDIRAEFYNGTGKLPGYYLVRIDLTAVEPFQITPLAGGKTFCVSVYFCYSATISF